MRNMKRVQQGFTLIELMIVIAIVAILVALAVPAYQDYTIRTKVSECINAAAPAKLAVAETFQTEGNFPTSDNAAGFLHSASLYCNTVSVGGSGVITVTTANTGASANPAVTLTPTNLANGSVDWRCAQSAGVPRHVPATCRTAAAP